VIELQKWQRWDNPSVTDAIQLSALPTMVMICEEDGGEGISELFVRVFEFTDSQLLKTDEVVLLNFADECSEVISSRDIRFVDAREGRDARSFQLLELSRPGELAMLFEMLKSMSTSTTTYRLYTDGQRAAIVREEIVEPEAAPEPKPALIEIGVCPAGGKHQLTKPVIVLSDGGSVHQLWNCIRCYGTVIDPPKTREVPLG